jgi:type IV pilus assembly protein PilB
MQGVEGQLKEFLLDSGLLSRAELLRAERRAKEQGEPLPRALVESGVLSEEEVRRALAHAAGVPYVALAREEVDPQALFLIPEPVCRAHNCVAFATGDGTVEVALLDLEDLSALDFLKEHGRILPRLTSREALRRTLLAYQKRLKERFDARLGAGEGAALEALLAHALLSGAAAIHLELPADAPSRVRYRIAGVLRDALSLSPERSTQVATQLKKRAGFTSAKRSPQEARVRFAEPEPLVTRVSLMPLFAGEKLVINISYERAGRRGFTLESLGFNPVALELLDRVLHAKAGLIVLVGPEGSGTSTALYTILDLLSSSGRSLASVERAVECRLPQVAQTQIDEAVGLTAAAALRGALRQDPDVVALADCTNEAVLGLVAQAARRNLLVLAADEAAELPEADALVRLRLVRRLCTACRSEAPLSSAEQRFLEGEADFTRVLAVLKEEGVVAPHTSWKEIAFGRTEGCGECESGYKGFVGVQEVLVPGDASLNLIEDGLYKAAQGITDIEEVLRLASAERK